MMNEKFWEKLLDFEWMNTFSFSILSGDANEKIGILNNEFVSILKNH